MNKTILILSLVFVLILIASSVVLGFSLTGKIIDGSIGTYDPSEIPFDYEYTTALCEGNNCRDYVVTCLEGEAIHLDPVSGMVIFSDDWEDKREEREFCGK